VRTVQRDEILDYQTYNEHRDEIRRQAMELKEARRVHVGKYLTFLFENPDTIRYQIQEMMRAEQIVKESDIRHEIDTYNELLGGEGELGCTLLIEIDDPAQRQSLLREWLELPKHLYAKTESGKKCYTSYDARQIGEDRLSSVQYLKFDTDGEVPVAIGCDLPQLREEAALSEGQRQALAQDLDV
jgi:Protein of unknown function (DUF3501)